MIASREPGDESRRTIAPPNMRNGDLQQNGANAQTLRSPRWGDPSAAEVVAEHDTLAGEDVRCVLGRALSEV
jgi:hypothetical protein